jgi:uncharacterized protein
MNQENCLVIFVKYPEKGKVKSRIVLGADDGHVADLYRCFIENLPERVSAGDYRLFIAFDPFPPVISERSAVLPMFPLWKTLK